NIVVGTKIAFTCKKKQYHGTIARTNTDQHKTILIDNLYNQADLIINGTKIAKAAFKIIDITNLRLSDDELLNDINSYNTAIDYFDNMDKEKEPENPEYEESNTKYTSIIRWCEPIKNEVEKIKPTKTQTNI
ncbi:MAG: hypothetical protein ACKPKO_40330, partial [Candidatus Fonsibacter sp.]